MSWQNPLAAFMMANQGQGQGLPSFAQQPQQGFTPPAAPPLQQATPQSISPPPMLGQGAPQQQAFNLPGSQPQSPIAQALQPKPAAPQTPLGAQAGMTWLDKMQPWLAALNFVQSQSDQPTTIGGGRGGGFSVGSGGLL